MKIETPVLKRLGPIPFWRGHGKCLDSLEKIYRRAIASANMIKYGDEYDKRRRVSVQIGQDVR